MCGEAAGGLAETEKSAMITESDGALLRWTCRKAARGLAEREKRDGEGVERGTTPVHVRSGRPEGSPREKIWGAGGDEHDDQNVHGPRHTEDGQDAGGKRRRRSLLRKPCKSDWSRTAAQSLET